MTVPRVRSSDTCATFPVTGALTTMQVIEACMAPTTWCVGRHWQPTGSGTGFSSANTQQLGRSLCLPTHLAPCRQRNERHQPPETPWDMSHG